MSTANPPRDPRDDGASRPRDDLLLLLMVSSSLPHHHWKRRTFFAGGAYYISSLEEEDDTREGPRYNPRCVTTFDIGFLFFFSSNFSRTNFHSGSAFFIRARCSLLLRSERRERERERETFLLKAVVVAFFFFEGDEPTTAAAAAAAPVVVVDDDVFSSSESIESSSSIGPPKASVKSSGTIERKSAVDRALPARVEQIDAGTTVGASSRRPRVVLPRERFLSELTGRPGFCRERMYHRREIDGR